MIYDIILFNGELDLLEIRLNILDEYVDEFIIAECPVTFSGNDKQLYFNENKERYSKWLHKIKYYEIDENDVDLWLVAEESPNTGGVEHWCREFVHRESIKKTLTHLQDEDICYLGDCDEIWKSQIIGDGVYKLEQLVYSYYLNNRSSEPWAGTVATKYKNLKNSCLNHLRAGQGFKLNDPTTWKGYYLFLPNAGWHFTNMGGVQELKRKIESYGHQELNTEEFKNKLKDKIKDNIDYMGFRDYNMWTDESNLPEYLLTNKTKWKHLLK